MVASIDEASRLQLEPELADSEAQYVAVDNGSGAESHRSAPREEEDDDKSKICFGSFRSRKPGEAPIIGGLAGIIPMLTEQNKGVPSLQEQMQALIAQNAESIKAANGMATAQELSAQVSRERQAAQEELAERDKRY